MPGSWKSIINRVINGPGARQTGTLLRLNPILTPPLFTPEVPMKLLWTSILLLLTGCSSSGVMPLGQDTYAISNRGRFMSSDPATIKAEALQEAKDYCGQQNKGVQVIEADQEGGGYGKLPETDMQFRCTRRH